MHSGSKFGAWVPFHATISSESFKKIRGGKLTYSLCKFGFSLDRYCSYSFDPKLLHVKCNFVKITEFETIVYHQTAEVVRVIKELSLKNHSIPS